jgi:hypothetical protein
LFTIQKRFDMSGIHRIERVIVHPDRERA